MTFVRALLLVVLLPALLLPGGARVCLHELLCETAHAASCGCCSDQAPLSAQSADDCCVDVPEHALIAPAAHVEGDSAQVVVPPLVVAWIETDSQPAGASANSARAAPPPPRPRSVAPDFALPLRL